MVNPWPFHSLFIIDMCSTYEYRSAACCCSHLSRLSIQKPLVGCTSHTGFHYPCKCQSSVWHRGRTGGRSGVRPIIVEWNHFTHVSIFFCCTKINLLRNIKNKSVSAPLWLTAVSGLISGRILKSCSCKDFIYFLQTSTFSLYWFVSICWACKPKSDQINT